MYISKTMRGMVAAAAIALVAPGAQAAGLLDGLKVLDITGIAESSLADGNMTQARSTLTSQGATITDVSIGSFSASSLAGIDILYVGLVNNGFTASQVAAIHSYVAAGGGLVAVGTERDCCYGPSYEQIANSFGLHGLGGDRNVSNPSVSPTSPIVSGPFGTATNYQPAATGAFASPLPAGATDVWNGADGNAIIVTLDVTGRAFFFGDTNFMEDQYINNGDNKTIWGNAFAFTGKLTPPVIGGAVPEPATWAMMVMGFGAVGGAIRRSRTSVRFA